MHVKLFKKYAQVGASHHRVINFLKRKHKLWTVSKYLMLLDSQSHFGIAKMLVSLHWFCCTRCTSAHECNKFQFTVCLWCNYDWTNERNSRYSQYMHSTKLPLQFNEPRDAVENETIKMHILSEFMVGIIALSFILENILRKHTNTSLGH